MHTASHGLESGVFMGSGLRRNDSKELESCSHIRHPGLPAIVTPDSIRGPPSFPREPKKRWMPGQVRHDESPSVTPSLHPPTKKHFPTAPLCGLSHQWNRVRTYSVETAPDDPASSLGFQQDGGPAMAGSAAGIATRPGEGREPMAPSPGGRSNSQKHREYRDPGGRRKSARLREQSESNRAAPHRKERAPLAAAPIAWRCSGAGPGSARSRSAARSSRARPRRGPPDRPSDRSPRRDRRGAGRG